MKRGFTLIELLAVILILGIIALIAIPTVNKMIEEAKRSSFEVTIKNLIDAIEQKCNIDRLSDSINKKIYRFELGKVTPSIDIKGALPTTGTIIVDEECNISFNNITDGTNIAIKQSNSDVISITTNNDYNVYDDGTVVYYNPFTGDTCNNYHVDNSLMGYNGDVTRKTTENQNGCLKFYTFNDEVSSSTVNLICDHNTTATSIHSVISNRLSVDTALWINEARILSIYDVEKIFDNYTLHSLGTSWCLDYQNSPNSGYVCENQPVSSRKYGWLTDRTSSNCTDCGCNNNAESYIEGYWLVELKSSDNSRGFNIRKDSSIYQEYKGNGDRYGVRPVIVIEKILIGE